MILDFNDLRVETFATSGIYSPQECCTGCVSGCGYFPTEGGCESSDGNNTL